MPKLLPPQIPGHCKAWLPNYTLQSRLLHNAHAVVDGASQLPPPSMTTLSTALPIYLFVALMNSCSDALRTFPGTDGGEVTADA